MNDFNIFDFTVKIHRGRGPPVTKRSRHTRPISAVLRCSYVMSKTSAIEYSPGSLPLNHRAALKVPRAKLSLL